MELTKKDWENVLALISNSPITGAQAATVVVLQQKIAAIIRAMPDKPAACEPPA